MGIFPDAQGQLTHKSLVGLAEFQTHLRCYGCSCYLQDKEDPIKNEELEWSQGFPLYNPIGAICWHGNQSADPIWPKTLCSQTPCPIMFQIKDWPAGLRDIQV